MRAKNRMLLLPATLLFWATLVWADDTPSNGGWVPHWFFPVKTAKKPAEPSADYDVNAISGKKGAKDAPPIAVPAPTSRAQAQAAYLRRTAVCLKLRDIADSTSDDALRRKVEQLETRVWDVYAMRTANLNVAMKEK